MKKLLVSGGSGFFGTELIDYLLEKEASVSNFNIERPEVIRKGSRYIEGNILDYNQILKASKGVDTIFQNIANLLLALNKWNTLNFLIMFNICFLKLNKEWWLITEMKL